MEVLSIEECLVKQMHVQTRLEPVRVLAQYGPFYLQRYKGVTYIRNDIIKLRDKNLPFVVKDILSKRFYNEI